MLRHEARPDAKRVSVIPLLLLIGLLAGRWYVVLAAAMGWPLLLAIDGTLVDAGDYFGAALLASANTATGVAAHKMIVWALTQLWRATGQIWSSRSRGEGAARPARRVRPGRS